MRYTPVIRPRPLTNNASGKATPKIAMVATQRNTRRRKLHRVPEPPVTPQVDVVSTPIHSGDPISGHLWNDIHTVMPSGMRKNTATSSIAGSTKRMPAISRRRWLPRLRRVIGGGVSHRDPRKGRSGGDPKATARVRSVRAVEDRLDRFLCDAAAASSTSSP